jgi:two-component system sensor histidine kinase UhpB
MSELPLFWRLFLPNALVLTIAGTILVLSPAEVEVRPSGGQILALFAALGLMLAINLFVIRRALEPLQRLTRLMAEVDPMKPGQRIDTDVSDREVKQLSETFNTMLDRLERERRESGRRMLAAQEDERRRVARELHDEIGQVATSLTLELDQAAKVADPELRVRLLDAREAARELTQEVNSIVRSLRPETLEDLGLASALTVLGDRLAEQTGAHVTRRMSGARDLPKDVELAAYRIAQESMTNITKHAGAENVSVELWREGGEVTLRISDDGAGLGDAPTGNGIRGMHERAMLTGGRLRVTETPDGTVVEFVVTAESAS